MLADEDKAKEIYNNDFKEDIVNAKYSPEVEEGILQMCEDLVSGRLQMRIHATKNLHAKFYLCLPQNHSEHRDGLLWVLPISLILAWALSNLHNMNLMWR